MLSFEEHLCLASQLENNIMLWCLCQQLFYFLFAVFWSGYPFRSQLDYIIMLTSLCQFYFLHFFHFFIAFKITDNILCFSCFFIPYLPQLLYSQYNNPHISWSFLPFIFWFFYIILPVWSAHIYLHFVFTHKSKTFSAFQYII